MKKNDLFWLGLIALVSCALGFFSLTRGHVWWDDFAGYLLQSKSILAWRMDDFIRHNTFTIDNSSYPPGPVAYPWGFPLLLAPVYAIYGLNALALKLIGLFFYAVFLVCMFFLARTRLSKVEALLLTGFLGFSPALLAANDLIQSDIPFLAFSTLSLVLIERLPLQKTRAGSLSIGLAAGEAIFAAFFMRTNGILLFGPLLLSVYLSGGAWVDRLKKAAAPMLIFGVLALVQAVLFPGGQTSYFSHFSMFSPARLLDNLLYYLWLPAMTFDQIPGGAALYPFLMIFVLISLAEHWRRDAWLHVYSLLTVLLFIAWPERQGLRFIYPVLPGLFITAMDGMKLLTGRLKPAWRISPQGVLIGFWAILVTVVLGISTYSAYQVMSSGRQINGPFDVYSNELYSFVRAQTPAESVMIFMRPRALRLFTGRDAFMTQNCADLPKGDFLILHLKMEGNGQIPPEQAGSCNPAVHMNEVFRNKRFVVYQISR